MKTARDLMTAPVECLAPEDSLVTAARRLAEHNVGSMPVIDGDDLVGILTDRDIVVRGLAQGLDPHTTTVREVATVSVVTVDAAHDAHRVANVLTDHQVRRVPVVEGGRVIGVIAQADLALALDGEMVGEVVEGISQK